MTLTEPMPCSNADTIVSYNDSEADERVIQLLQQVGGPSPSYLHPTE